METDLKKKLKFFEKKMNIFFLRHKRQLPWRKKNITPYEVWVSEIFLQQTQAPRVVLYYKKFMKRFPDITSLARANWKEFFPYYRGLGYYGRGRNMLKTAKIIVEKYKGIFPQDKNELEKLPGVGEYTASAILSFGYKKNVFSFDTNLQKVFGRYLYGSRQAKIESGIIEQILKTKRNILNAAIMDFSSLVCTIAPKCQVCPLRKKCKYYEFQGRREKIIVIPKIFFPTKSARVFLWIHKGHKIYYSSHPDSFCAFELPPEKNSREAIKKYFLEKFGLELSVRPPHKKVYVSGIPTLFVNAQIQLGTPRFGIFPKSDAGEFYEKLMKQMRDP